MTTEGGQPKWEEIQRQISLTTEECIKVADRLRARAERISTRKKIMRGVNIAVGGAAFIAGVIIPSYFTTGVIQGLTALASVTLFADGLLPSLFEMEPPERLKDYAFYIRNYSDKFNNAMIEETTDVARKAKVMVLLDLARTNLTQVRTNWAWVEK